MTKFPIIKFSFPHKVTFDELAFVGKPIIVDSCPLVEGHKFKKNSNKCIFCSYTK